MSAFLNLVYDMVLGGRTTGGGTGRRGGRKAKAGRKKATGGRAKKGKRVVRARVRKPAMGQRLFGGYQMVGRGGVSAKAPKAKPKRKKPFNYTRWRMSGRPVPKLPKNATGAQVLARARKYKLR